jgi:ferric-dicitrate binding protein FerR (iron transport regulator)
VHTGLELLAEWGDDAGSPSEDVPSHVVRVLAGEATAEERAEAERWIGAAPGRRARFAELERLWRTAAALPSEARIERMWQALAREVRGPGQASGHAAGDVDS